MAAPGARFSDLLRYGELIGKVIMLVKEAEGLAPGESLEPDDVKFRVKGKRYTLDPGTLTRNA